MLNGRYLTLNTEKGFDCNTIVTPAAAALMKTAGYDFVYRYVPRGGVNTQDLTTKEANDIIYSGLGLGVVQHVAPENWTASGPLGARYGAYAAARVAAIGFPTGTIIWCDLEGLAAESAQQVIDFCNEWHKAVVAVGFQSGLYVGWHPRLDPQQLYSLLTSRYWGAYNEDVMPATRGLQLKQSAATAADRVAGITFQFDVNHAMPDKLGGRVIVFHK